MPTSPCSHPPFLPCSPPLLSLFPPSLFALSLVPWPAGETRSILLAKIFGYLWRLLIDLESYQRWAWVSCSEVIMVDSAASYIRMVQHLIEKCLIFHMSQEECMEALSKHANIKPVITSTVWKELEKENKEFFAAYDREMEERATQLEMMQRSFEKMLSGSTSSDDSEC